MLHLLPIGMFLMLQKWQGTFRSCSLFNEDISSWDVSNVESFRRLFHKCYSFNQNISRWDVSSAFDMRDMFNSAYEFNQSLIYWCVSNILSYPSNFALDSGLSESQYPVWGTCPVMPQPLPEGTILITTGLKSICDRPGYFITIWKTDNDGYTNSDQILFPLAFGGTYDFTIYWGDGSSTYIDEYNETNLTHTYSSAGIYEVRVSGTCYGFGFFSDGDQSKLLDVANWGSVRLHNYGWQFSNCDNLTGFSAPDTLLFFKHINSPRDV